MKFKTKQGLNEFCKTEIGKLDESKLYVIHIKLNIKGIKSQCPNSFNTQTFQSLLTLAT